MQYTLTMYKTQSSHVVLNIQNFRRDSHLKIPDFKNTKLMTRQIYDKLNNIGTSLYINIHLRFIRLSTISA